MCSTCGCGMPKNKHGQKTVEAANKKYAKKKDSKGKAKKSNMVRKKGMQTLKLLKRSNDLAPERGLFHLSFEVTPGKPGTLLLNLRLLLEDLL